MKNIGYILGSNNRKLLHFPEANCGSYCRDKINCPLDNQCLTPNIIYKVEVTNNIDSENGSI